MTLAEFRRTYPAATFTVSGGKPFTYRYYQNPQAKATLVLLTGGIGLSDLFYKHFARFARDFSVLSSSSGTTASLPMPWLNYSAT